MKTSVLLVESHADLRSVIVETLRRADCRCDAVATPDDAVLKLRDGDYSYILLDLDAPSSVMDLCDVLSGSPALLEKLVLITGADTADRMPGQPRLQKPFDTAELLASMNLAR